MPVSYIGHHPYCRHVLGNHHDDHTIILCSLCHNAVLCYFHPCSLNHCYIITFYFLFEKIISLYHHFYKRLFKQDFLSNSSQACFWSVLMCLWLVWNDLIWSHCRIAINLVMQCTILYWCFEHFKPWNQILWKPMRILLCGAAILDIVCIIGSLFYAYNIQMVVHTFTDLLYQDWNMCDNLVSKLKFC